MGGRLPDLGDLHDLLQLLLRGVPALDDLRQDVEPPPHEVGVVLQLLALTGQAALSQG